MNCHSLQAPKCDIIVVVCVLGGQAACGDAGPHEKVAGRRGRPPGSKNKRTLAMESLAQQGLTAGQQQAAMALLKQRAEQKRQEDEENLQAAIASGQKRRGRPPGSRNRPRDEGTPAYVTECKACSRNYHVHQATLSSVCLASDRSWQPWHACLPAECEHAGISCSSSQNNCF